jgi:hypothetical protein
MHFVQTESFSAWFYNELEQSNQYSMSMISMALRFNKEINLWSYGYTNGRIYGLTVQQRGMSMVLRLHQEDLHCLTVALD